MRSLFLLVLFPRIIAAGRGLFASRSSADTPTAPCTTTNGGSSHNNTTINANGGDAHAHDDHDGASSPATTTPSSFSSPAQLPTAPECFDATAGEQTDIEPVRAPQLNVNHHHTGHFDLVFLRWSLVIDGALTTITAFATKRWHIYLGKSLCIISFIALSVYCTALHTHTLPTRHMGSSFKAPWLHSVAQTQLRHVGTSCRRNSSDDPQTIPTLPCLLEA